jgi:hypothetical protein
LDKFYQVKIVHHQTSGWKKKCSNGGHSIISWFTAHKKETKTKSLPMKTGKQQFNCLLTDILDAKLLTLHRRNPNIPFQTQPTCRKG